jgi:hypothetical protein
VAVRDLLHADAGTRGAMKKLVIFGNVKKVML